MSGSSGVVFRKLTFYGAGVVLATIFMSAALAVPAWAQTTTTLNVAKSDTGSDPVTVGQNLTYTIAVDNTGSTNTAQNVVLTDPLPTNTTFVSASLGSCTTPATGASSGTITCTLGNIAPADAPVTVTIVVRPTAAATVVAGGPGSVTNTATADGSNTDPASDTESTQVQPIAGLTITKDDDPDPVDVGESLIYTIDVTNNTSEVLDLDLVDDLPNSVDFIAVEPTPPSASFCEETSGIVTCEINDLAVGATFTAAIAVEPEQSGTIQNTPQVFCASTVAANCPSANPDTFTPIAQTTESTTVEGDNPPPPPPDDGDDDGDDGDDGNNNNGNNDNDNNGGLIFEDDFDDEEDEDILEDEEDEDIDDTEDLDDNGEDAFEEDVTDGDTTDDGVLAEADSGEDPDDLPPVSEPQGDVVDELPPIPLPETAGISLATLAICGAALSFGVALVLRRMGLTGR